MQKREHSLIYHSLFIIAVTLVIYMPLHVFIAQSASLLTGGLEVWKAGKDVLLVGLMPLLLLLGYRRGLFSGQYKWLFVVSTAYVLLHGLFVLFDTDDHTNSAIVASVYNARLLGYMLLGMVVGSLAAGKKYAKWLVTASVLIASAVALFGVLQYFLPSDLLTHVGYSLERGVKPLFFIDDKPDLPRVMSTLKDPNSLGAYLIVPLLITGYAFMKRRVNETLFIRPFRKGTLAVLFGLQFSALLLTFSRGASIGFVLSTVTLLYIVTGQRAWGYAKKYWRLFAAFAAILLIIGIFARDSYVVQNVIFHADESTVLEDPNELRVTLTQQAVDRIVEEPLGHGPGTAGLVAIRNPKGGVLTENYYLQIAHEVGWLGLALFITILGIVTGALYRSAKKGEVLAQVLLAALVGYLFYSLLIHLWSSEAISLQWWLLSGVVFGLSLGNRRLPSSRKKVTQSS